MTVDLEFLGKQTERILSEIRQMHQDVHDIKVRLTALEASFGLVITQIATLNGRLNRFEERLEQLES